MDGNAKQSLLKIARINPIFFLLFTLLITSTALADSVTLRWQPSGPATEGYRLFARKSGQAYNYRQPDWEGAGVTATLNNLESQTEYYMVVRAFSGNIESADSNEVHYIPPATHNDDDGLPDDWEAHFGLDPLSNDADLDLDHDGISNRDEFRAGLEPDERGVGKAPLRPKPLSPKSYSQTDFNVLLDAGDYSDIDGDAHIATQWQVYETQSKDCMLDVVTNRRLNQLKVPFMLLDGDRTYHWRVRFFDSGGRASAWSAKAYFITQSADNDLDENGVSDDRESDPFQAEITRSELSLSTGCEPMRLVVASENTIRAIKQVTRLDPFDLDVDETAPDQLPASMVAYKLLLRQPGQRALVIIHLSDPAPDGATWIKYDAVNGWQDYSDHAAISTDRQSVKVEVKDGGYGDADGVANGIILDPAGLSIAAGDSSTASTAGGGGGGGGCFIDTMLNASEMSHGIWQWITNHYHRLLANPTHL